MGEPAVLLPPAARGPHEPARARRRSQGLEFPLLAPRSPTAVAATAGLLVFAERPLKTLLLGDGRSRPDSAAGYVERLGYDALVHFLATAAVAGTVDWTLRRAEHRIPIFSRSGHQVLRGSIPGFIRPKPRGPSWHPRHAHSPAYEFDWFRWFASRFPALAARLSASAARVLDSVETPPEWLGDRGRRVAGALGRYALAPVVDFWRRWQHHQDIGLGPNTPGGRLAAVRWSALRYGVTAGVIAAVGKVISELVADPLRGRWARRSGDWRRPGTSCCGRHPTTASARWRGAGC